MLRTVVPARKNVVIGRTIMVLEPSQDADASRLKQFELDGPACLLLHDGRSCSHPDTADEIADPDFDDVTEADCPHLLRLQRSFGADHTTRIPGSALSAKGANSECLIDTFLRPELAGRRCATCDPSGELCRCARGAKLLMIPT